jgi:hypothetical protein
MTISHFLHLLALFTFVSTNVTIFFYAFPAYRRSHRLAFLLLVISCGLGTFINVWDWTVIQTSRTSNPNQYYWFYCIREVFYVICAVCGGVASFLLIRALDPHTSPPALRDLQEREHPKEKELPKVACPACDTEWELTAEEAIQPTFTCAECGNTTYLPGELAAK